MAKYRCPSCGATHKDPPHTCRLCGAVMDGSVETTVVGPQVKGTTQRQRGLSGVLIIGIVVVLVLAVGALALHVVSGGSTVNNAVAKIGVNQTPDGWKTVNDPEGGFKVSLPPNAAATSVSFAAADDAQVNGWLATVGDPSTPDSQIYVLYAKVDLQPGESPEDAVSRLGQAKVAADGGFIETQKQTTYQGYPAMEYKINRITYNGGNGYENALLFLRGQELYIIETVSGSPGAPATTEYQQVKDSLQFTSSAS